MGLFSFASKKHQLYDVVHNCVIALEKEHPVGSAISERFSEDDKLSEEHFVIRSRGPVATIEDLGSDSGTMVNGHVLLPGEPRVLRVFDVIRAGNQHFIYSDGSKKRHELLEEAKESATQRSARPGSVVRGRSTSEDARLNVVNVSAGKYSPAIYSNRGGRRYTRKQTVLLNNRRSAAIERHAQSYHKGRIGGGSAVSGSGILTILVLIGIGVVFLKFPDYIPNAAEIEHRWKLLIGDPDYLDQMKRQKAGKTGGSLAQCNGGDGAACYQLGRALYMRGDQGQSWELFGRACELDVPEGCYMLAVRHLNGGEEAKARQMLDRLCNQGLKPACDKLTEVGS